MNDTRDLPLWDVEAEILTDLLTARDRLSRHTRPAPVTVRHSPVRKLVPATIAAVAAGSIATAAVVVTSTNGGRSASPSSTSATTKTQPNAITTIRMRAVAALVASGDAIVHTRAVTVDPGGSTCVQDIWTTPAQPVPGRLLRERNLIVCDGQLTQDTEMIVAAPDPGPALAYPLKLSAGPGQERLVNGRKWETVGELIEVDGASRTWSDVKSTRLLPPVPAEDGAAVRSELANQTYVIVGHATIDGRDALELRRADVPELVDTVWVDATSYLPVRSRLSTPVGVGSVTTTSTIDYDFLPATPANVALLTPVVPPGYTQKDAPPAYPHG